MRAVYASTRSTLETRPAAIAWVSVGMVVVVRSMPPTMLRHGATAALAPGAGALAASAAPTITPNSTPARRVIPSTPLARTLPNSAVARTRTF